ncbi:transmembrane protein 71 isoform X2 [Nannospalax galili]|uniref:transmembrane protein 71 isoform X2 n=1 Tax=Nannospalax galili TaxID=1026970 RepID=UPI00111C9195|nr:transmembrane protein 71 isoform X2 [Nannospalax galili]
MYRVSQLMSTPVANSSRSDRGLGGELSPTCIFPSFDCSFLDGDSSFECCSIDPLTGSHCICRRSPRLLTNGYYIWTEDSFLCDPDGHITLNPSHTSVIYKENLVRIFRKKKRAHRSVSSLLDLRASKSWLHGSMFGDSELPSSEDIWLEGIRSLDSYYCNENGGDRDCSLSDGLVSQTPITDTPEATSSVHVLHQPLSESSQHSSLQSQMKESEHFQENVLVHSKANLMYKVSFQAVLLTACLIVSACARWLMGGELVSVFTWPLMVTIVYIVKSLFLNLASYFKATACAGFDSS